jgi:hypothetical protein
MNVSRVRVFLLASLLTFGALMPIASAVMTASPSHTSVTRIADQPTPTPTRTSPGDPPPGCSGGGC